MGNELNGAKGDKGERGGGRGRWKKDTGGAGSERASESTRSGHSANRRINHPATH